ncbi:hypothetical protein OFM83_28565, partial [Escherichia coli]|nr:hypothetical protein [Escherichia coli]
REKPSQNVEARDVRQTSGDDAEKAKSRDEQQPRRERTRRRNDDKRQAQQEAKAQTREEPVVQETEQEERVQTLPRRKPRQLAQKVRVESA